MLVIFYKYFITSYFVVSLQIKLSLYGSLVLVFISRKLSVDWYLHHHFS